MGAGTIWTVVALVWIAASPAQEFPFPRAPFGSHIAEHQAFNFDLNVADIREGWNEIVVYAGTGDSPFRIVSLEIGLG